MNAKEMQHITINILLFTSKNPLCHQISALLNDGFHCWIIFDTCRRKNNHETSAHDILFPVRIYSRFAMETHTRTHTHTFGSDQHASLCCGAVVCCMYFVLIDLLQQFWTSPQSVEAIFFHLLQKHAVAFCFLISAFSLSSLLIHLNWLLPNSLKI